MTVLLDNTYWMTFDIDQAVKFTQTFKKGPHTKDGIIYAGKKCGFSKKKNGVWEFNADDLRRYCVLSNKPTLLGIAKRLKKNISSVKYMAMKFSIPFHTEMGRKYLNEEDAEMLYKLLK